MMSSLASTNTKPLCSQTFVKMALHTGIFLGSLLNQKFSCIIRQGQRCQDISHRISTTLVRNLSWLLNFRRNGSAHLDFLVQDKFSCIVKLEQRCDDGSHHTSFSNVSCVDVPRLWCQSQMKLQYTSARRLRSTILRSISLQEAESYNKLHNETMQQPMPWRNIIIWPGRGTDDKEKKVPFL